MKRVPLPWFCAFLVVLIVLGVESLAWATDGQPLIVGQDNTATQPTTLGGDFTANSLSAQSFVSAPSVNGNVLSGNLEGGTLTLSGQAENGAADVVVFAPGQTKITLTLPRPTDNASSQGSDSDYPIVQMLGKHPGIQVMADTSPHDNPFTQPQNPVSSRSG